MVVAFQYHTCDCNETLFSQNLEEKERKAMLLRDQLECENRHLRRRLEQLNRLNLLSQENNHNHGLYRVRQERSISECSTSTNLSSSSMSSTSSIKSEESGELQDCLWLSTAFLIYRKLSDCGRL